MVGQNMTETMLFRFALQGGQELSGQNMTETPKRFG